MKTKVSIVWPIKLLTLLRSQSNLPLKFSFNLLNTNASFRSASMKAIILAIIMRSPASKTGLNCSGVSQLLCANGSATLIRVTIATKTKVRTPSQIISLAFCLPCTSFIASRIKKVMKNGISPTENATSKPKILKFEILLPRTFDIITEAMKMHIKKFARNSALLNFAPSQNIPTTTCKTHLNKSVQKTQFPSGHFYKRRLFAQCPQPRNSEKIRQGLVGDLTFQSTKIGIVAQSLLTT